MKTWKELKQEEARGKRRYLERLAQTREADKEIEEYEPEVFPTSDDKPKDVNKDTR